MVANLTRFATRQRNGNWTLVVRLFSVRLLGHICFVQNLPRQLCVFVTCCIENDEWHLPFDELITIGVYELAGERGLSWA